MIKIVDIRVIPNSKKEQITEEPDGLRVKVMQPAVDGKANKGLIILLADHFGVRKSAITILSGETSRTKRVQIELDSSGET